MAKRIFGMTMLVLAAALPAHAQGFWKSAGEFLRSRVQVDSPAIEHLTGHAAGVDGSGAHWTVTGMIVRNGLRSGVCDIWAYSTKVATLEPGGEAYDYRRVELQQSQIPLLAQCWESGRFLGAAARVFYLNGYGGRMLDWTIRAEEIVTPAGERISESGFGSVPVTLPPPVSSQEKRVKFPREWWGATLWAQIVNVSQDYDLRIRVNGRDIGVPVGPGQVYFHRARVLAGYAAEEMVEVEWQARGLAWGHRVINLYLAPTGPTTQQYLLTPRDAER